MDADCALVDERTHRDAVAIAWPEDVTPGSGDDRVEQLVVDRLLDDHPTGAGACLTAERERRPGDDVGGGVEVGVGEHDDRVLAAELELQSLAEVGGGVDLASDCGRSGERHRGDVGMGDEMGPGGEAVHDVEHAGRQAGVDERLGQPVAHQRSHRRRLEHDGVAGGEGRVRSCGWPG